MKNGKSVLKLLALIFLLVGVILISLGVGVQLVSGMELYMFVMCLIGSIFLCIGGILFFIDQVGMRRRQKLKDDGKFVYAQIVDIDVDLKTLAEDMTRVGNEYDSAEKLVPSTKLVIGKVLECKDHPDSDHLHVCKVNIGTEILQIVCGAPNVREGLKVIVALDGAELPDGKIKKGKIRGEISNGMICSIAELGLDNKFLKEEDKAGIHELPQNAPIGEDPIKYM